MPREKHPSQSGRRASSGTLVTASVSPQSNSTCNDIQTLSSSYGSLDSERTSLSARRAIMLQRQNATTVDPDAHTGHERVYQNFLHSPPRPPSQPRPKSAKGSLRSGSRPLSGGQPVNVKPPLSHSPVSFSKYKPLPGIGSKASSGSSSSEQSYKAVTQHGNQTFEKTLSNKVNELSLATKCLPSEPSEEEGNTVHLAIKVLDGTRHERWFRLSDTVADIFAFAESVMGEKLPENCQICTNDLPRRTFRDPSQTLESISLQSRTVLHIQEL